MFIYSSSITPEGGALNTSYISQLAVEGSGSSWGIQAFTPGGNYTLMPNGTYSSKADAVAAVQELLTSVGYVIAN